MRISTKNRPIGFTLVELLVVVVILGIIVLPLTTVLISFFVNSATTTARVQVSHDEQIATGYFAQDVAAVGIRDTVSLTASQSVWSASPFPSPTYCGAGLGTTVVLLAWNDVSWNVVNSSPDVSVKSAAYVVESSGGQNSLHRIFCTASSVSATQTTVSDIVIASNLTTPGPSVVCTGTGCPTSGGPTVPTSITLKLNLKSTNPGDRGATLPVSLVGQRRQS